MAHEHSDPQFQDLAAPFSILLSAIFEVKIEQFCVICRMALKGVARS